ncbi:MAG: bacteriocin [Bacteroidia bacterium]|nr:bacteriocin [Bacteroidia bacterium]
MKEQEKEQQIDQEQQELNDQELDQVTGGVRTAAGNVNTTGHNAVGNAQKGLEKDPRTKGNG